MKTILLLLITAFTLSAQTPLITLMSVGTEPVAETNVWEDSNTVAWYEMDSTVTKDVNDKVTSWADLSGEDNHLLQADTSKSPTYTAGGLVFDGVNDFLKATFTLVQPETIYIIAKVTWDGGVGYVLDGTAGGLSAVRSTSATTLDMYVNWSASSSIAIVDATTYLYTIQLNGSANSGIQLNTGSMDSLSLGVTTIGGFTLGANNSGANSAQITVKAAIIRKVVDSSDDQTAIRNYLNGIYSVY